MHFIDFNSASIRIINMSEKTFFGTIDFRNAKYQGAIKNGVADGLALLFDH